MRITIIKKMELKTIQDETIVEDIDYSLLKDLMIEKLSEYNLPHSVSDGLVFDLREKNRKGVGFDAGRFSLSEAKQLLGSSLDMRKFKGQDFVFTIKKNRFLVGQTNKDMFRISYELQPNPMVQSLGDPIRKLIEEKLQSICIEMVEFGEATINQLSCDTIYYRAFQRFKQINHIDSPLDYYDLKYSDTSQEGFTHILSISTHNLYIRLPKIEQTKEEIYINRFV